MTHAIELWEAIRKSLSKADWTTLSEIYHFVQKTLSLDEEDFKPQSPSSDVPKWKRNVRNVLQRRKKTGDVEWDGQARYRL